MLNEKIEQEADSLWNFENVTERKVAIWNKYLNDLQGKSQELYTKEEVKLMMDIVYQSSEKEMITIRNAALSEAIEKIKYMSIYEMHHKDYLEILEGLKIKP